MIGNKILNFKHFAMNDFHKLLWFDEVYDESFKNIFPVFQKLWIKNNHTIASESGYFVKLLNDNWIKSTGSDIFSPIVNLSKIRYPEIDFSIKDMRNFYLKEKVELISCLDWCINHVFSLEEVFETFESVYKNLEEKWYFYFEFWTENEVSENNELSTNKKFQINWFDITQRERRLGNNIHNMMTKIEKDWEIIDILNAYHTSFNYEEVIKLLYKAWFKKHLELNFSDKYSKKILAFKY